VERTKPKKKGKHRPDFSNEGRENETAKGRGKKPKKEWHQRERTPHRRAKQKDCATGSRYTGDRQKGRTKNKRGKKLFPRKNGSTSMGELGTKGGGGADSQKYLGRRKMKNSTKKKVRTYTRKGG